MTDFDWIFREPSPVSLKRVARLDPSVLPPADPVKPEDRTVKVEPLPSPAPTPRKRKARRARFLYLYFIQRGTDGPIKIGISARPNQRLGNLQTAHCEPLRLLGYIDGSMEIEQEWHARFASCRIAGEWFHPAPELLAAIETSKFPLTGAETGDE